jgi:hypothetical protein
MEEVVSWQKKKKSLFPPPRALAFSQSASLAATAGRLPPPPPSPYSRCVGHLRAHHRRRAPARYAHSFASPPRQVWPPRIRIRSDYKRTMHVAAFRLLAAILFWQNLSGEHVYGHVVHWVRPSLIPTSQTRRPHPIPLNPTAAAAGAVAWFFQFCVSQGRGSLESYLIGKWWWRHSARLRLHVCVSELCTPCLIVASLVNAG